MRATTLIATLALTGGLIGAGATIAPAFAQTADSSAPAPPSPPRSPRTQPPQPPRPPRPPPPPNPTG